jgi:carboxyl-terminal processing protease
MLGTEGTKVHVTVQSPGAEARDVEVPRARVQGQLPVLARRFDGHAPQSIGYLLLPTFWDETIAERAREQLAILFEQGSLEGLIIDMRINGGGAYSELSDFLSLFASGDVGEFRQRQHSSGSFMIESNPIANSFEVPLVVLVGAATESYAEIFSGILQAQRRAVLIGQPTAGNVETIYPFDLEDGSRLWLALETFTPPSGADWEGQGVQPDIVIPGNWEDFTDQNDPQLQAALNYLQSSP